MPIELICDNCKKKFERKKSAIKRNKHFIFCSNKCKHEYFRNHYDFKKNQDNSIFNTLKKLGENKNDYKDSIRT